ncbi:MAG: hypothetical protein JO273_19065, partial [Methylobacteriaceae bacterium]|nr:hypothetical protein [Methylobacteriaceae bacterium]
MNSFLHSFRPILVAAAVIFSIEIGVQALVRPNAIERSNFLDLNYMANEPSENLFIYEKLKNFIDAPADVIQVGDSSGFLGIVPSLVERYLNGMTYANLSCCFSGFRSYYEIAKAAMAGNRKVKALVLHIALTGLPQRLDSSAGTFDGDGGRTYSAFGAPWARLSPPSLALRSVVTDGVYSLGGLVRPMIAGLTTSGMVRDGLQSIDRTGGWWSEVDLRWTAGNPKSNLTGECGKDDMVPVDFGSPAGHRKYYEPTLWGDRFYAEASFEQFAELAAQHGAKLVIAFQPHPCAHMEAASLALLRSTLRALQERHSNVFVVPDSILEHWPIEMFVFNAHVRAGYEVEDSRRLGRLLAPILGASSSIASADADRPNTPPLPDADSSTPSVWSAEPKSGLIDLTRGDGAGPHRLDAVVPDINPGPYVMSLTVKSGGQQLVRAILWDSKAGRGGVLQCDLAQGAAVRFPGAFDAGIESLADGWYRCWVSVQLCDRGAAIGID